jgi:L-threonylcarbamoyladenylate synthase
MKTLLLKATDIAKAAFLIKKGKLVAFPTETVYGLGANALDAVAVRTVFEAKERPLSNPLIVHCDSIEMVRTIAHVTPQAEKLAKKFWPGPLTLILKKKNNIPGIVTVSRNVVAVRIPAHPIALKLITASGVPIAAPSANMYTRVSPTDASHVLEDLSGKIDAVIDGGRSKVGVESTVLDLTTKTPRILRPGGVALSAIQKVIPGVSNGTGTVSRKSPGTHKLHYSPKAPVVLVQTFQDLLRAIQQSKKKHIGVLAYDSWIKKLQKLPVSLYRWGAKGNDSQLASRLYAGLRELDRTSDIIFCPLPKETGLGEAIVNRLQKVRKG